MDKFAAREKEIFSALQVMVSSKCNIVVIGGYAVNAYALPRFSVDCDLVTQEEDLRDVGNALLSSGFVRVPPPKHSPYVNFSRYEKEVLPGMIAAFDVLVGEVHDRQSGTTFAADWIFSHSSIDSLPAKTFAGQLKIRVVDADSLFIMKFCSARGTDIRDIFMLCDRVRDWKWVGEDIASRIDLGVQHKKIMQKVSGKEFSKDLGGVFGYVEPAAFEKRLKILESIEEG
ncbi:hypothetical protein FJZ26_04500 [Candidatus Parvarchaeota archaeon]|nr:hypothetical protein [Candidatus Parvarchaeota archaeon]